jgi:3-oxoacyl-[acyl-carrier protein] reductase
MLGQRALAVKAQRGVFVREIDAGAGDEQSMGRLAGSTMVVTGASRGIGRSIALAAARAGADVALTYHRSETGARETADEIASIGRTARVYPFDASDPEASVTLASRARADLGRIDAWVNNAGADILTGDAADRSILEKLEMLIAVDLRGTMTASWAAADIMREQPAGGVIINVSWDHVLTGMKGTNPELFAAVKGGVLAFSKSLARSVAPRVRVNVVAPGWIETAFGSGLDQASYRRTAESIPLGRWGTTDDVAAATIFLASPDAAFLTGQTLLVNGGDVM